MPRPSLALVSATIAGVLGASAAQAIALVLFYLAVTAGSDGLRFETFFELSTTKSLLFPLLVLVNAAIGTSVAALRRAQTEGSVAFAVATVGAALAAQLVFFLPLGLNPASIGILMLVAVARIAAWTAAVSQLEAFSPHTLQRDWLMRIGLLLLLATFAWPLFFLMLDALVFAVCHTRIKVTPSCPPPASFHHQASGSA